MKSNVLMVMIFLSFKLFAQTNNDTTEKHALFPLEGKVISLFYKQHKVWVHWWNPFKTQESFEKGYVVRRRLRKMKKVIK